MVEQRIIAESSLMKKASEPALSAQHRLRRIEGRHNPLVKQLRQAFSRAELTEGGDCAIEGLRILEEAIRSGLRFSAVFFRESAQDRAERLLPQIGAQVETLLLPDKLFDSLVPSESPQGVAALVRLKEFSLDDVLEKERVQVGPIVVLAGLQDPGNLGTILRSSEAFGSAGVVLGEGTVSPFNSKVVRASAGSVFRLPVIHGQAHSQGKSASGKAGGGFREAPGARRAPDRNFLAQRNAAGSSRFEGRDSDIFRQRRRRPATGSDGQNG